MPNSIIEFFKSKVTPTFKKYWEVYKNFNNQMKQKPYWLRALYLTGKICFWILVFLIAVDMNFFWLFGRSPKLRDLNNPQLEIASELYSADSVLIGRYFDKNRTPVKYDEISPLLIKTLVATEDQRFYNHHGFDVRSSISVFWYMAKGKKRGGSTITQEPF